MRKRYIADGDRWIEVGQDYEQSGPSGPFVIGEIPAYTSPIDGRVIDSRAKRRDDLARSQSRPWEGMAAEKKEADRIKSDSIRQSNERLNESVARAYYQLSPEKRRILRGA
jgi:hypothetical protein